MTCQKLFFVLFCFLHQMQSSNPQKKMYSFAIIIVLITQIKQFIRIIKFKDAITYYLALFITLDKETRITNFNLYAKIIT
jgi:hypothetical protein